VSPTPNLLTWEAFEQLPDDCVHRELLAGELVELPLPKSKHSVIAMKVVRALRPIDRSGLGMVFVEAGYKLWDHPPTWIQPDVSVLSRDRFEAPSADGYFHGSPELAIEIVSPSETARDLNRKIDLLLANGSSAAWIIYPEDEEVRVFLPDRTSFAVGIKGTLMTPEVLGAVEVPVAHFFKS
jgi:Uma2 family endonuclease